MSVKDGLTSDGTYRRHTTAASGGVENDAYATMLSRMLRAYARRVGDGDPDDLATMLAVRREFDRAIAAAVGAMRSTYGFSWADIGRAAGMSRQAAHEKWGQGADIV